jgi:hypothetical protein
MSIFIVDVNANPLDAASLSSDSQMSAFASRSKVALDHSHHLIDAFDDDEEKEDEERALDEGIFPAKEIYGAGAHVIPPSPTF